MSKTFSNFNVWGCPTYFLETKFHKPGVNIIKLDKRSKIGLNMGFINMKSTQAGSVINLLSGLIS